MIDYKTQHENRRESSKDLGKSLLLLLLAGLLAFFGYTTYIAYAKNPDAIMAISIMIVMGGFGYMAERTWHHTRLRKQAENRLFDMELHKKDIIDGVTKQLSGRVSGPAKEPDIDSLLKLRGSSESEVLENLKFALPGLNYYTIEQYLNRYKDFPKVKGMLLNARKFWDRDKTRPKHQSREEIEGINPSPRIIEFG